MGEHFPSQHARRTRRPDGKEHIDELPRQVYDERMLGGELVRVVQQIQKVRQQPQHRAHAGGKVPPQHRHDGQQQDVIDANHQKHFDQQPQHGLDSKRPPAHDRAKNDPDQQQKRQ